MYKYLKQLTINVSLTEGWSDLQKMGLTDKAEMRPTSDCMRSAATGSAVCLSKVEASISKCSWEARYITTFATFEDNADVLPDTKPVTNSRPDVYKGHHS